MGEHPPTIRSARTLRRILAGATLAVLWALAAPAFGQSASEEYQADVRPLLEKYCYDCHQGAAAEAGLALESFDPKNAPTVDRATWSKVLTHVQASIMPPADAAQPEPHEREKIVAWIDARAMRLPCGGPVWPGRVTVRRLNKSEYNNTIRDLLGVEYVGVDASGQGIRPADGFPSDDVGYGFDNIGDVLSLPPVLFERYLEAAEKVATRAIVTDSEALAVKRESDGRRLASEGEAGGEFEFPQTGEYILRIVASADQAGPEPARMSLRVDGQELRLFDVLATDDAAENYELRQRVEAGRRRLAGAFVNDYYNPSDPDPSQRDRNLRVHRLAVIGPLDLGPEAYPESHRKLLSKLPAAGDDKQTQLGMAEENLRDFASRAFRRPATEQELSRLRSLVESSLDAGDSFPEAMQLAVQAVLVSPAFLFRVEAEPTPETDPDGDGIRDLDGYELASRLSYFLWSSLPDGELLAHAKSGELTKPEVLKAQALRMLKDDKSRALVENFASQWLHLRNLPLASPDPRRFPDFDDELRLAMTRETMEFVGAVVREDRSVLEFIDADYAYVNARLAKHYGLEGVEGNEFRRVSVDRAQRGGLLGQASILTVSSNPTRTSPVKRGKWVLENLLGAPPPPPPPNVPELKEPRRRERTRTTLRERLEVHRADPGCAACHKLMDPIGFGLENYNAVGAWRTEDGEAPIDTRGDLPDGKSFTNPAELKTILLSRQDEFRRCLSEKLFTFALGRGLEYYDVCAVERISASLAQNDNRFSTLVAAIVESEAFRQRADNGKLAAFLERSMPAE